MRVLTLRPITLKEANRVVARLHRHNRPTQGGLFAVGCADELGELVGVAIVGRPIARLNQDGYTAEITRTCTDGTPNANSLLYGACCRAAKALGYRKIITYTLAEESGVSLRAAGFEREADVPAAATWSVPSRHRVQVDLFGEQRRPPGPKVRWCRRLTK